jgi:hypothetical protein
MEGNLSKGTLVIEQDENGTLLTEIILDPQLTRMQREGEEDLNDVQIIFGILASVLDGVLRFQDEEEAPESLEGALL